MIETLTSPKLNTRGKRLGSRKEPQCAHRSQKDLLASFLLRHPFTSRRFLEAVFGEGVLRIHLEKEAGRLREVLLPDLGVCYALKEEPNATLLGTHRREQSRWFMLSHLGSHAIRSGISPGREADGEFCSLSREGSMWWRVWVDMGGCAPEAFPFITSPPRAHGKHVHDVVLAPDPHRLDLLAAQIELNWRGSRNVQLYTFDARAWRTAHPRRMKVTRTWRPPSDVELETNCRQRIRGSRHRSRLAGIAKHLSTKDWVMLAEIGDNPLFTNCELACLHDDAARAVGNELKRLDRLERYGLIKTASDIGPTYILENRKVLTWRGIELLAEYWGTSVDALRRFHPWPLRGDGKGNAHVEYATRWAAKTEDHQRATRQFVLALLDGARRVSNGSREIRIRVGTTIASRLAFLREMPSGESNISWVTPDARLQAELWRHRWIDGERMPPHHLDRRTLLVEVDRETAPFSRISNRLNRYADIWHTIQRQRTALLWVVEGSPSRERQILDAMRRRSIRGWTSTLERLVLPREDIWWLIHPPVNLSRLDGRVSLPWRAVGGMAPWRCVWLSTEETGYQPLLGWDME